MTERLRFALDQNFPPFVLDVAEYFPNTELKPLFKIEPRLCDLDDRRLIIYLHQAGWHGLISNNYRMLWVPPEIAAIVKARIAVFAIEGLGDDPLRATGSVLLHLPAVLKRVTPGKAQVFRTGKPRSPQPDDAWQYFEEAAHRRRADVSELYEQVKVTDEELDTPIFE
ncbi:hypothetical protein EV646_107202 [Kribbella antiqua]|uniref:VapC45 PIN like domain-containing protein n=1 Tax=Kribbella antiqua TaxID=2512217 RepID=A0A4V2S3Y0_9ACTN|nr:hypothetical protein [Kribbella antiqua]TCO46180.1 hypothetical protein EV646_107202 [Kribbella antiqua]